MKNHLCWIRRDLRISDHHALFESLKDDDSKTYLYFNFDPAILDKLPRDDRRITFIIESLINIEIELNKYHSSLIITYGDPILELEKTISNFNIDSLFFNRDYEPYAKARDEKVIKKFNKNGFQVNTYKDLVIFEKYEILNEKKEIYKVFTPYKNKWLQRFLEMEQTTPNYKPNFKNIAKLNNDQSITKTNWLSILNFVPTENLIHGGEAKAKEKLNQFKQYIHEYKIARDYPSLEKTSSLSPYLRMGNISIRECVRFTQLFNSEGSDTFLSELIWREFYQVILDVYPRVENTSFKIKYDQLKWANDKDLFEKWKNGQTGFPIIDASMRCLNETGLMHNRLRMVVASFLTKTLLIDWRYGEKYFALKLLDYDMAANNGGWQWSASTGVDAQPYFRIFNPFSQSEKFDAEGDFIKMWCPELKDFSKKYIHFPHDSEIEIQNNAKCIIGVDYPAPIVSYKLQKEKALKMFKAITA